ncbi:anaerobic sulfatase maturase [Desulfocurvibacter africanus]|uniref:anaerobic sulfatase maturase n=1 Tax=Desulfocurvibacter africanus TaxID=873 RepID=UPI002FD9311C
MTQPTLSAFHVMAKPTGARCNLRCDYCFFLEKQRLYPGSSFRMSNMVMETYIRQTLESHSSSEVTIAWQGGEPTLMGLDFFRRSMEAEKKFARPGVRIENTLQTNGVLLDDAWCEFLREHGFLVGLSLDGPRPLHDAFRRDKKGDSVFKRVERAARTMRRHGVAFNILCTVNAVNSRKPLEVYRYFRDALGAHHIQFIPIVERSKNPLDSSLSPVTERSVSPQAYGRFLIEIFDEWVRRDVGSMFVQYFEGVLASWVFGCSSLCTLRPTCGDALVLEHNGDVYSCDHFVEPEHLLGNILQTPLAELVASEKQQVFGRTKSSSLPGFCRKCAFLFTCHGECPKNRLIETPDGEPGLNWLCAGLKAFFAHTQRPMRIMAGLLRSGRSADEIMDILATERAHAGGTGQGAGGHR